MSSLHTTNSDRNRARSSDGFQPVTDGGDLLDRGLALAGLVALSPVLAVVALLVRLVCGRPVLFRQQRAGLHARPFTIYKFRTMRDGATADGRPLPDEQRLTALGRGLRATSLDELPELWNVVRGDLRLVGPRPLPVEYLPRYTPAEARRHEVKPGLTGWAQIHGRNAVAWEERLAQDTWYVDHRSAALDRHILRRTLLTVLRRDGISAAGHVTMRELRPELAGAGA